MLGFRRKLRWRQTEKATGLCEDISKLKETATFPDDIEQISVLAGRRIGPFACCALPRIGPAQPNEHRPAGRVARVSDDPVSANPSPIRKIMSADNFRALREAAIKIRSLHEGLPEKGRPAVAGGPKLRRTPCAYSAASGSGSVATG